MAQWYVSAVFLILLLGTGLLDYHVLASARHKVKGNQVRTAGKGSNLTRHDAFNKTKTKGRAKKKVRFTVKLELPASKVDQLLNNKDETQYNQLSKIIADDIQKLYSDVPGEHKVYNLQFSSKHAGNRTTGRSWVESVERHGQSEQEIPEARRRKALKSTLPPTPSPHSGAMTSATTPVPPFLSATTAGATPLSPTSGKKRRKSKNKKGRKLPAKSLTESTHQLKPDVLSTHQLKPDVQSTHKPKPDVEATHQPISDVEATTKVVRELTTTVYDGKFNVARLTMKFKDCFRPSAPGGEYIILMEPYIEAYNELLGIFNMIGPIFAFAGEDIRNKLTSLRALRSADLKAHTNHYASLQSMFEYEHSPQGAAANLEGVKENRWLHRAMKFISAIIKATRDDSRDKSLSSRVREAYDAVLAPHHEWYVKMGVHMALISFPSRDTILGLMEVTDDQAGLQAIDDLASAVDAVSEDILKLNKKYSLPEK